MRRFTSVFVIAALAAVVVSCAGTTSQIPVGGNPADVAALAGQWSGDYESPATGRTGSIVFTLSAGADTAHGDVVMLPRAWNSPGTANRQATDATTPPVAPQTLTISFVAADKGHVMGRLDPYRDPDCDCMVVTTFDGVLKADAIEGTFRTIGTERGRPRTGTWKVTRKKQ
jgi:hypothetical protein